MVQIVVICASILIFLLTSILFLQEGHDLLFISQGNTETNTGKDSAYLKLFNMGGEKEDGVEWW